MRVLILDDNLLWTERFRRSVNGLGHEAIAIGAVPTEWPAADVAIVNLAHPVLGTVSVMESLKAGGARLIGHVGHVEKELIAQGEKVCDVVATNGKITFQIESLLAQATKPRES